MNQRTAVAVMISLLYLALGAAPTPLEKYEVLSGEGLSGSGFVVRHADVFWGVCSLHQFDGDSPGQFEALEGDAIEVDPRKAFKQRDVQALPVKTPAAGIQFLPYEPAFELKKNDELIVLGPAGEVVPGRLSAKGLKEETYKSGAGPATLELRTEKPFIAAGGSGAPVILKRTGAVIGVLLSADDAKKASVVGFETLCLDGADPNKEAKPTLKDLLKPLGEKVPKGSDLTLELVEVPSERIESAYIMLPDAESKPVAKATRQIVGYAGQSGLPKEEAVGFLVFEFSDAEIAKRMPARMAEGYKGMVSLFRLAGISISDIKIEDFNVVKSDAAKVLRATGTRGDDKQPFSNTIIRATRGLHMVELLLRNFERPDEELAKLVSEALDRAAANNPPDKLAPVK